MKESNNKSPIPVFTTSDAAAEFLDNHYEELNHCNLLNNCSQRQGGISYWMNKEIMLSKAKDCGLVVPFGLQFNTSSDVTSIFHQVPIPCILKPQKVVWQEKKISEYVIIVNN